MVAAIGGNVLGQMRLGTRRNEIATDDIEVLQLGKKFVRRIGWQIPDLPLELHGFQATNFKRYTTSLWRS